MIRNFAENLGRSGLVDQGINTLRSRLVDDPDNINIISRLAELNRKIGNLDDAISLYYRLSVLEPENPYSKIFLGCINDPTRLVDPYLGGFQPVPFVLIKNFLPEIICQEMISYGISNQSNYVPSRITGGIYNPDHSRSVTMHGLYKHNPQLCEVIGEHIREITGLRHLAQKLDSSELQIKAYGNGDFFKAHQDETYFPEEESVANEPRRRINFGYFFHQEPKSYTGGDLLLFDTDFENDVCQLTRFTRIVTESNMIIFYPSAGFHEVSEIRSTSAAFGDRRFAVIGHISG